MSESLVLGILAVIGGVAGAGATIITALRKVEDSNPEIMLRRIAALEARSDEQDRHSAAQDRQISALDDWKLAARHYIATLRGALADRGIPSPEPPPELELHREE